MKDFFPRVFTNWSPAFRAMIRIAEGELRLETKIEPYMERDRVRAIQSLKQELSHIGLEAEIKLSKPAGFSLSSIASPYLTKS